MKSIKWNVRTDSNRKYARRVYKMFFISAMIIVFLMFLLVYQPMKNELEKSLIDNFAQVSHSNYHSFETSMQRGIEGAKSLSSRTMIKSSILEYKSNEIGLEQLKSYTQPKYEEGARALEHLITAERVVDGVLIARYHNSDRLDLSNPVMGTEKDMIIKINLADGQTNMIIISPIFNSNEIIGYDRLVYDLDKQIRTLCTDTVNLIVLDDRDYDKLLSAEQKFKSKDEITVFIKSKMVYGVSLISDHKYLVSTQELSTLFEPVFQLAVRIVAGGVATFIGYSILAYIYIIRHTLKELGSLEFSRNEYRQIAYQDGLTGLFNRNFLDVWNRSVRFAHTDYTVIMIDIDDFKYINDFYGHSIGDRVLQTIGTAILKSIRNSDIPVRYGGDEFLLILSNATIETTQLFLDRLQNQIDQEISDLPAIHISYGVSMLTGHSNFEDVLKQADKKMYECKNKKKG